MDGPEEEREEDGEEGEHTSGDEVPVPLRGVPEESLGHLPVEMVRRVRSLVGVGVGVVDEAKEKEDV